MTTEFPAELHERFETHDSPTDGAWKATEKSSGRKGVLQVIPPGVAGSGSERERLKRELVKQTTLSHENLGLPSVVGDSRKSLWLFREAVDGETLRARLDKGVLVPSEAIRVCAQVAAALDELHRAGLLFRDLRPERILLRSDGTAVVVGASIAPPIEHDEVFDLRGTAEYLSPEQAKGKLASFRSDLYALGCILFEAVTGKPPFEGDVASLLEAHAEQDPPDAPSVLPEPVRELLTQLLEKSPRKRPFSAMAARKAFDPFLPEALRSVDSDESLHRGTLLGMPAHSGPPGPPSMAPPRPPSMAPPRPPSMQPKETVPEEAAPSEHAAVPPEAGEPPQAVPHEPEPELELSQPAAMEAEVPRKPGTTPRNPDATQQVSLADIEEVRTPRASSAPPPPRSGSPRAPSPSQPPQSQSGLPSPPPQSQSGLPSAPPQSQSAPPQSAAPAQFAASQFAASQPAPAFTNDAPTSDAFPLDPVPGDGPDLDDLDYDDLAPTMAREGPSSIAAMNPSVPSQAPASHSGSPGYSGQAPASQSGRPASAHAQQVTSYAPVGGPAPSSVALGAALDTLAQPAPEKSRGGLYFVIGAGMLLAAVALFVGYQAMQGPETVAVAPTASQPQQTPQTTPQPAVTPTPAISAPTPEPEVTPAPEVTPEQPEAAVDPPEPAALEVTMAPEVTMEPAVSMRSTPREDRPAMTETARGSSMGSSSPLDQARDAARAAFQARDFAAAEQAYLRVTALSPRDAGSWAGLGAARMQTRDYSGAVQAYQRAVTLNPRSSGFFTSLGHAFRSSGDSAGARQAYSRALALNPNNQSAQRSLESL